MAKRKIIDVRRGGVLIPIGNNTYLAKGRTHEQGGIDIGDDLEIENNEVAQLKDGYLKIFSAQPILNGYSPSQLVLGGANPDRVFNAQERFKKVNKLNDDGSKKKKYGDRMKYIKRLMDLGGYDEIKSDNTYVNLIPLQEFVEGSPKLLLKQRIQNNTANRIQRNDKPLQIISPEFDVLSLGSGALSTLSGRTAREVAQTVVANIVGEVNPVLGLAVGSTPNLPAVINRTPRRHQKVEDVQNYVNDLGRGRKKYKMPSGTPTEAANNREWLKMFNRWNTHYGYDPIDLQYSNDAVQMDNLVKERLNQHNTFVRGVRPIRTPEVIQELEKRGIEPTDDNIMKFFATTYAPETGAGRAGFHKEYDNEGTIYTSNSLNTAKGYATPKHSGERQGKIVVVRRPIDYSSSDRNDWIRNADFNFYRGVSQDPRSWQTMELPYMLKTGRSLRQDALDIERNGRTYADYYNEIYNKRTDKTRQDYKTNEQIKIYNEIINEAGLNDLSLDINFDDDKISGLTKMMINRDLSNIINMARAYANNKNNNIGNDILKDLKSMVTTYKYPNPRNKRIKIMMKKEIDDIKKTANYRYNNPNDYTKHKLMDEAGVKFGLSNDNNVSTSEVLKDSRKGHDPYQHFIFRGNVGEKGLEFVKFIDPNNIEGLNTRNHIGNWSEGLSRKGNKFGGKHIDRMKYIKNMLKY